MQSQYCQPRQAPGRLLAKLGGPWRRWADSPVFKITIKQPGRDDRVLVVQGNEALIGRAKECDVIISDRHVSGRHAKVLAGLVVIDLDSTNGTFVDGQRIRDAVVLRQGTFRLGADDEDVRLEITQEVDEEIDQTLLGGVEPETVTGPIGNGQRDEEEPEELEASVPSSPRPPSQPPPARDPREETLSQNRELRGRVKKLEAKLAKYAESVAAPLKQRIKGLEEKRSVLERAVKALRTQLAEKEANEDIDGPATEVVTELQSEIDRLRTELHEAQQKASRLPPLQVEVRRLEEELEKVRAADGPDEDLEEENQRLKMALRETRERLEAASNSSGGEGHRILELEKLLTERTTQIRRLEARLAESRTDD